MRALYPVLCFLSFGLVQAQTGQAYNCTPAVIEQNDDMHLAIAEKIALMEEAFFVALDAHEECISQMADSGGGGTGAAGAGNGQGDGSGANSEDATRQSLDSGAGQSQQASNSQPPESQMATREQNQNASMGNGKANEKLQGSSNDCIIKQKLLEKANAEPDPQRKHKLMAAYKSYQC